jgi:hypothetical protein
MALFFLSGFSFCLEDEDGKRRKGGRERYKRDTKYEKFIFGLTSY